MKFTGVVRRIDELGRFVIPKEIREQLGMVSNTPIEISLGDDCIILKKQQGQRCVFCSSDDNLELFKNKYVCKKCIKELR